MIEKEEEVTINSLLALIIADVDVFLLKDKDQVTDKDQVYSKDEIRKQLEETLIKFLKIFSNPVYQFENTPLIKALTIYSLLTNSVLSEKEKIQILKENNILK